MRASFSKVGRATVPAFKGWYIRICGRHCGRPYFKRSCGHPLEKGTPGKIRKPIRRYKLRIGYSVNRIAGAPPTRR
jgi:hypothetical protein